MQGERNEIGREYKQIYELHHHTHTHTQPTETVLNNFEITKSVKNSSKIYKMQIDEKMGIKKTQ